MHKKTKQPKLPPKKIQELTESVQLAFSDPAVDDKVDDFMATLRDCVRRWAEYEREQGYQTHSE